MHLKKSFFLYSIYLYLIFLNSSLNLNISLFEILGALSRTYQVLFQSLKFYIKQETIKRNVWVGFKTNAKHLSINAYIDRINNHIHILMTVRKLTTQETIIKLSPFKIFLRKHTYRNIVVLNDFFLELWSTILIFFFWKLLIWKWDYNIKREQQINTKRNQKPFPHWHSNESRLLWRHFSRLVPSQEPIDKRHSRTTLTEDGFQTFLRITHYKSLVLDTFPL